MESEKVLKLKIINTIISMMEARGYLKKKDRSTNIKKILESNKKNDKEYIFNMGSKYLRIKMIDGQFEAISKNSELINFIGLDEKKTDVIIIVAKEISNLSANKFVMGTNIEIFKEERLLYDILESPYASKFFILSEEEKKKVMKEYNIDDEKKFPCMLVDDPVSKYFNAKPGTLFRILRPSKETIEAPYYRIVV